MHGFSLLRFMVLVLIHAILEQSMNNKKNGEQNLTRNVYYCYLKLMQNLQSFAKPQIWNDGRWR